MVLGQPHQQVGSEVLELIDYVHQAQLFLVEVALQGDHFLDGLVVAQQE